MNKLAGLAPFAAATLFSYSEAMAVVVACPQPPVAGSRIFTIDTTPGATCLASAAGNLDGSGDAVNSLGYVTLDKSDDALAYEGVNGELTITGGPNSGTFSFVPTPGFFNFVIAFKSGSGTLDPDWAAFALPAGVLSGLWTISSQGLSHVNLYGQRCDGPCPDPGPGPSPVPLPAPFLLLGLALGGLGAARWLKNRRTAQVA
jgi:hypothetical protein